MIECNQEDWYDFTRKCPKCGGDVHVHHIDTHYDPESGDEWNQMLGHCHQCGTEYGEDEFLEMDLIQENMETQSIRGSK